MLNIRLTIKTGDSEKKVTAGPATQVAFEREHGVGIATIATEQKITHIYWLAWHAAKTGASFDDWLETIDAIEVEVESADPSLPAQPAA